MHDALVLISQRVNANAKFCGVIAQRLNLSSRGQIRNWQVNVLGWGVVVLGCNR